VEPIFAMLDGTSCLIAAGCSRGLLALVSNQITELPASAPACMGFKLTPLPCTATCSLAAQCCVMRIRGLVTANGGGVSGLLPKSRPAWPSGGRAAE
jgi:hypothetical protein